VLAEDASSWFELDRPSPYMLFTVPVRRDRLRTLPEGFPEMTIEDRLLHPRSELPAVTHVDGSARVQTVHRETNGRFHDLLSAFRERTGCPVLLNTSFNVRGEPIVCTPGDAYRCFIDTDIDHLVLGDFLFSKDGQAAIRPEESRAQEALDLD
jgi:carbamoyltransferase